MDFLKTKIYLDKLNREFSRMNKDPENVARIDEDIMLSYVRELYDALLTDASQSASAPTREQAPAPKKSTLAKAPEPAEIEAPAPASPPPVQPPPPVVVRETPPPVVEAKAPVDEPEPQPVVPPKPAASSAAPPEAEALFEEKQVKELSDKLSDLPITDLKRAIALNDRLLLTRELFSGDAQSFEMAINTLNSFSSFEDARLYMLENCVLRYGWLDKKRIDAAKSFIKLVRRRYK
jgi:hypothetical protein